MVDGLAEIAGDYDPCANARWKPVRLICETRCDCWASELSPIHESDWCSTCDWGCSCEDEDDDDDDDEEPHCCCYGCCWGSVREEDIARGACSAQCAAGETPRGHGEGYDGKSHVRAPGAAEDEKSRRWEKSLQLEDVIYYRAKLERHRSDERRRVEDWVRVMGDLKKEDQERKKKGRREGRDGVSGDGYVKARKYSSKKERVYVLRAEDGRGGKREKRKKSRNK